MKSTSVSEYDYISMHDMEDRTESNKSIARVAILAGLTLKE